MRGAARAVRCSAGMAVGVEGKRTNDMKKTTIIGIVGAAAVAAAAVGFWFYARKLDARAERAEEAASAAASKAHLFCFGMRREDVHGLWSWVSEEHRRGHPPGASLNPLEASESLRNRTRDLCGEDPEFDRQMEYVGFLIEMDQWYAAARRLYELEHVDPGEWPTKLEIVMPPNKVADALLLAEHRMPNFALSAWERWHPTDFDDSRAQAFTMIGGAASAWHLALANRLDLFAKGSDGAARVATITKELGAIGLNVQQPKEGEAALDWAWTALYPEFERLGREAELMDPKDDKLQPVARLREEPYDYRRFRDLLRRVRPDPTTGVK